MKKLLFNPFERIAGWKALAIGICFMSLTAVLGKINNLLFDGILNVTPLPHSYGEAFYAQGINWVVLSLIMWIAGKLFSKSNIRILDIAGTIALSRTPLLLFVFAGFLPFFPSDLSDIYKLLLFNLIYIIPGIWMVALMYRAYSISCNMKGTRGVLSFTGALIAAEFLSLIIFFAISSFSPFVSDVSDNQQSKNIETVIPEGQTVNQTAEIVIEAFQKSDIKTVRAYFDETMKNASSVMQLRTVWGQITMQHGKLKDFDRNVTAKRYENHSILLIPCTFERGKLNMQIAFDSEGKIAGLYFVP